MPTLQMPASVHAARVLDRAEPAPNVVLLGLHAPDMVRAARPGQFVMALSPSGARASTALGLYEAQGERASLLFFVCGARTRELADMQIGASLSLLGPLGNGFALESSSDAAIVAGGVGIASVYLCAQALRAANVPVRLFYGARTKALLVERDRFARAGCEVLCATDDGSFGYHGFVTDLLAEQTRIPESIFACGPSPMLRATASVARRLGVRAQLSLEETFACGVGGCWGCVVPIDPRSPQAPSFPVPEGKAAERVHARICKEGPVFWAHELQW